MNTGTPDGGGLVFCSSSCSPLSLNPNKDPHAGPESIYSLRYRNYSVDQFRFTSEDPAKDDLNPYRPVGNNPVNEVDPSGLYGDPVNEYQDKIEQIIKIGSGDVPENFISGQTLNLAEQDPDVWKLSLQRHSVRTQKLLEIIQAWGWKVEYRPFYSGFFSRNKLWHIEESDRTLSIATEYWSVGENPFYGWTESHELTDTARADALWEGISHVYNKIGRSEKFKETLSNSLQENASGVPYHAAWEQFVAGKSEFLTEIRNESALGMASGGFGFVFSKADDLYDAGKAMRRAKTAAELRKAKGIAQGGEAIADVTGRWLKGSHGNVGKMPGQIANQLRGRSFSSFDDFRSTFWKAVAKDKILTDQFSKNNIKRMREGLAPIAHSGQHHGKLGSLILHHKTPIQRGGGVYDLDNILIVTPKQHQSILDSSYHFGN